MTTKNAVTAATTEENWEVVSEPRSTIVFEGVGDEWQGFYEGRTVIRNPNTEEDYDYLTFRDESGDPYQVSASYDLNRAFSDIDTGSYVKIILTELKESNRGNDIKLYKVLIRR